MNFKDIPRILKGVFTTENVSDDEITVGSIFLLIITFAFLALIILI